MSIFPGPENLHAVSTWPQILCAPLGGLVNLSEFLGFRLESEVCGPHIPGASFPRVTRYLGMETIEQKHAGGLSSADIMLFLQVWAFLDQPAAQGHQCPGVSAPGLLPRLPPLLAAPRMLTSLGSRWPGPQCQEQQPKSEATCPCHVGNPLIVSHLLRAQVAAKLLTLAQYFL